MRVVIIKIHDTETLSALLAQTVVLQVMGDFMTRKWRYYNENLWKHNER